MQAAPAINRRLQNHYPKRVSIPGPLEHRRREPEYLFDFNRIRFNPPGRANPLRGLSVSLPEETPRSPAGSAAKSENKAIYFNYLDQTPKAPLFCDSDYFAQPGRIIRRILQAA